MVLLIRLHLIHNTYLCGIIHIYCMLLMRFLVKYRPDDYFLKFQQFLTVLFGIFSADKKRIHELSPPSAAPVQHVQHAAPAPIVVAAPVPAPVKIRPTECPGSNLIILSCFLHAEPQQAYGNPVHLHHGAKHIDSSDTINNSAQRSPQRAIPPLVRSRRPGERSSRTTRHARPGTTSGHSTAPSGGARGFPE